ncbi:hypothetical protein [sulfur-oxidizing endosymbiont of Gigantopelta aegis]|uniref:hypothetical protein n=1 Tax=sulfur-oxidizing endosymbiont of Gigantopelta aegis TaxID=2794934 RepID=UPI0018DE06EE|nr:hypothetical protein [sulfur-oxidizing endosymbiont of Gigantopelta aegis]
MGGNVAEGFYESSDYKNQLNLLIADLTKIQQQQARDINENGIVAFDIDALINNHINIAVFSDGLIKE